MNKKIALTLVLGIGTLLLISFGVWKESVSEQDGNLTVINNQVAPDIQDNIAVQAPSFKVYQAHLFSIEYPAYLNPYNDSYLCDVSPSSLCNEPNSYTAFLNDHYSNKSGNNEINRIDVYLNTDITKVDLKITNKKTFIVGKNSFVTGNNTDWLGGKAYWIQGKGYALRITFRTPKEDMTYTGFVNLASLKLK